MKARGLIVTTVALVGLASTVSVAAPSAYPRPGRTERVSVASNGAQAGNPPLSACQGSGNASSTMSADGRYVAFNSGADNLVPDDTNTTCDVFVHDRVTRRTTRESVSSSGAQTIGFSIYLGVSSNPSISADGRFVAFSSAAVNLVPGDTNLKPDVFVRDRVAKTTVRVSVGSAGAQGNNYSEHASVSSDGRFVAFESEASNLVPGDANGTIDVFVRDLRAKRTILVSAAKSGAPAVGWNPSISGDGRYVVFQSNSPDLDANHQEANAPTASVYRRDLRTGKTITVSLASDGSPANLGPVATCTTQDLRNLSVPEPAHSLLRSLLIRYDFCGSRLTHGLTNNPWISHDGRYTVFISTATNFVPNDTNAGEDIFVHDAVTHRTERISVDSYGREMAGRPQDGRAVDGTSFESTSISGDGRFVSYFDRRTLTCDGKSQGFVAATLARCTSFVIEAMVYDRLSGARDWASSSMNGTRSKTNGSNCTGGWDAVPGGLSRDGRYLPFYGSGEDLVPGDTNGVCDYFVRDRGAAVGAGLVMDSGSSVTPPAPTCVAAPLCLPPVTAEDAQLQKARVVQRPALRDLFLRWDLQRLARVTGAPAGGVLYGMQFTAGHERYQVRVQRVLGADYDVAGGASFGLFRESLPGVWTKVATLKGGYGTVGDAVVTAVPLSALGGSTRISDVTAYTAIGSYLSGATKVLDSLRLAH